MNRTYTFVLMPTIFFWFFLQGRFSKCIKSHKSFWESLCIYVIKRTLNLNAVLLLETVMFENKS